MAALWRPNNPTMNLKTLPSRVSFVALVTLTAPLAHPQTPRDLGMHLRPHEEGATMPYMAQPWVVTTPQTIINFNGFTSYQVNVNSQQQNIVNDAANEPSLTIDPNDPNKIAVGWRQFDNINSNFRQAGNAFTTNGGVTWTNNTVLTPGTFRSDPVLDTDAQGNFHYNSLLQTFFTDQFRSTNGGASYINLGPATGGDKQWMIVDRTGGASQGFVYQAWSTAGNNYGGRQFSRSTNGGSTWMNPINIPNQPVWGTMAIRNNGDLYLCGCDFGSAFYFSRSTNAKNGSVTPTFDLNRTVNMGGSIQFSIPVNPDGLGGQVWIVTDNSGGPRDGWIYMLCSVRRNATNPLDVMLSRSTDGGNTWSTPVRVNDDPQNQTKYHWFGTMSIAPNGRLDFCWYDTRASSNNSQSQLYFRSSNDGGTTFTNSVAVSPLFTQGVGYPQQNKLGDYIGMISFNGYAGIAYAATFNGEQDVYYVKVPLGQTTQLPPTNFSLFRGLLVSGGLAQLADEDNDPLVAAPGLVLNLQEAPVQLVVEATSPTSAPVSFRFKTVSRVNTTGLGQTIDLFNYQTQAYETVDTRAATTAYQTVTVDAGGNLSRFVDPVTRQVRSKISLRQTGPVSVFPWTVSFDQTQWSIGQ
jgi:hypothetical protein